MFNNNQFYFKYLCFLLLILFLFLTLLFHLLIYQIARCNLRFENFYHLFYKKYNLNPDMVVFGKALGNGYAITAVLGKKNIMVNLSLN